MFDDDNGRGSYKCGRCGVPKKGHVCPYHSKVKRRPGEPLPEMKCVSTQVEMDEFMTLRRLNLEIQGLPESYASEPMFEDRVGVEVHGGGVGGASHHPSQVMVSSSGGLAYSQQAPPVAHSISSRPQEPSVSHPSGLPSLKSMNSHPQPTSYSEVGTPYLNSSAAKAEEHVKEEHVNNASKAAETTTQMDPNRTKAEKATAVTQTATDMAESETVADGHKKCLDASEAAEITTKMETKSTEAVTSPTETKPSAASAETAADIPENSSNASKAVEITSQTDSTLDEKAATTTESTEIESNELSEVTNFVEETESVKEKEPSKSKSDAETKEDSTEAQIEVETNKRIKLE